MNPLKTIWLKIQETIEERVETSHRSQVILLLALFGISWMFGQAYLKDSGNEIPLFRIVVYALFVGPFVGAFFWFVLSGLTHLTGTYVWGRCFLAGIADSGGLGDYPLFRKAFALDSADPSVWTGAFF